MNVQRGETIVSVRAFLASALPILRQQKVIPPPVFHPYIAVGRDYEGAPLMSLPEYAALEHAIEQTYPRFGEDVPLGKRDFAGSYIFSFLEACVARCSSRDEPISAAASGVEDSVNDLVLALEADRWEVSCCRVVSHLTTVDRAPLQIAGLEILPVTASPGDHSTSVHQTISSVIPGAASAYSREEPFSFAPPESVIVARTTDAAPFGAAEVLSDQIEQFMLIVRLLHAGTCQSEYEVRAETSMVRRLGPTLVYFHGGRGMFSPTRMIRRTVRLTPDDDRSMEGLRQLLSRAQPLPEGMVVTSLGMAIRRFQMSYHSHTWFEQIIDLATAFEASLTGMNRSDVSLRLRTRAAALLATERDPAELIFRDVTRLYNLRSTLIHGGALTERSLSKTVRAISTVPDDAPSGIALGHAVDRLRDLVRRGLLARVCLAGAEEPIWDFSQEADVDSHLSDDSTRKEWRSAWRRELDSIGAAAAADRPRIAVDFISQEDL